MAVFEMRNARKAFGALEVLKGVSLKVEKGEVVSIIGPSGGGKSTMLRCATLLETMDSGTLAYGENVAAREENGKSVYAGKAALAQVRRQFGLVFQQFDLFPHYTVLKNVCDAPISVQKRDRAEVEAEAMALLDKMGLKGKENAYPYQLSGGQQQRVAIARALAMKPEILFFDEPTSALDPLLTGEVLRVIRSLADEHMTMVIVTHEMPFARAVSDRVVFLDGGVIVEQGSPEQVFENPQQERTERVLEIVPRDEQRSGVVIHEQVDDRAVALRAEFIAVGFDHLIVERLGDGGREALVLRPVGAVVAQIEHDLVGKRIANLLPCVGVDAVQRVAEVNVAEHPARIVVVCVVAARAGEDRKEVALLLGRDPALVRELVRAGRGQQHRGRVHVHV